VPKRNILLLAEASLFVFWCVLSSQMNAALTASQEPKPSLPEKQKPKPSLPEKQEPKSPLPEKQEPKSSPHEKSILAKIESALDKEEAGTLIVADEKGDIVQKLDVKKLRRDGFKSLVEYAHKKAESDECERISTRCVKCPDGKIYCSNDPKFVRVKKSDM